jgi:DNA invertase Pin-like site-specific DNA recombinase
MEQYIAYYRVSTTKQYKSGLGLDVQQEKIKNFIEEDNENRILINQYVEQGSGNKNDRIELDKAMKECKKTNSTLLIYKLDRFSRRVSFISTLMESNTKFLVVEMPTATDFQLHIYAAMSQEERRVISQRTKEALRQAKLRGVKLGITGVDRARENKLNSKIYLETIKDKIIELRKSHHGYSYISNYLNGKGYKTYRNKNFHPSTIKNYVLELEKIQ